MVYIYILNIIENIFFVEYDDFVIWWLFWKSNILKNVNVVVIDININLCEGYIYLC